MPRAIARRREGYAHDVEIDGEHRLVADEPEASGGANAGPSPTRMLAGALAACTAITCEMYAERKGWELGDVEAEVQMEYDERGGPSEFNVTLRIGTHLKEERLERLRVIAGKCPVHRALAGETRVTITDHVECV